MMPLADLFVHIYVLVDDALAGGPVALPRRPGPLPACSDAEVLTIALVRHLLGRPSEAGFLAEGRRDWRHYCPHLPAQSEFNRRVRWLWGAFETLRQHLLAASPADPWQQIDPSALPVKHPSPSRVRRADQWQGPNELCARFGWDAAHGEWFYGFRLGLRTALGSRLVRAWGLVPAAVDERAVADALLEGSPPPSGLLLDRGFLGRAWAAQHPQRGTRVPRADRPRPSRARAAAGGGAPPGGRAAQPHRDDAGGADCARAARSGPAGAHSCWGLLTRTAATLLAHTLLRLGRV